MIAFGRQRAAPAPALPAWQAAAGSLVARLRTFESLESYARDRARRAAELEWQQRVRQDVERRSRHEPVGFRCSVDGLETSFTTPAGESAQWREGLSCEHCRLNARMRLGLSLLRQHAPRGVAAHVYLGEQASFAFRAAHRLFDRASGSEFVQDEIRRGHLEHYLRDLVGDPGIELRHEDPTALGFATGSFDAIGSFELLQRLPDPQPAVRELARVLRHGGALVMSLPFLASQPATILRARATSDGIEHLLPPELHEEPASGLAMLCWRHFGWDLLDLLRDNGFERAAVADVFAPDLGFFGDNPIVVARRGRRRHGR